MHTLRATVALCGMALLAGTHPLAAQANPDSLQKDALIRRILEVTRTADVMLVAMDATLPAQRASSPGIPPVFWDRFAERAHQQRTVLLDLLVPIYARHFSTSELQELLRFYASPLGKRFIEVSPEIARESLLAGQEWGMRLGQEVGAELQREGILPRPPSEEASPSARP